MQTPDQRAKSTGPKTEAGKERIAAANTRRAQRDKLLRLLVPPHSTLLCNEDRPAFFDLLDANLQKYRPTDNVELEVVGEIVSYTWRIERLGHVETAIWNRELLRQAPLTQSADPQLEGLDTMVNAAISLAEYDATLRRIARDRAESTRLLAAAERRLVRLRRHFPGQGITEITSAADRDKFCFAPHP